MKFPICDEVNGEADVCMTTSSTAGHQWLLHYIVHELYE